MIELHSRGTAEVPAKTSEPYSTHDRPAEEARRAASAPANVPDTLRLGVVGLKARMVLWNGDTYAASFFLHTSSARRNGQETLGERLNDPGRYFAACDVQGRVELVNLRSISYVEITGRVREVEEYQRLGATRAPATLRLQCGRWLAGEFLYILPMPRARISDLLNQPGLRFALFLTPGSSLYVHRDAIVRVLP